MYYLIGSSLCAIPDVYAWPRILSVMGRVWQDW